MEIINKNKGGLIHMRKTFFLLILILISCTVFSASIIQIRRDLNANWASTNPILAQGEIGLDLNTNGIKFGNGLSTWNALPYYSTTAFINWGSIGGTITNQTDLTSYLFGNFLTKTNADGNYVKIVDINNDINAFTQNQTCPVGQVLQGIGLNLKCVTATSSDVNYTPIVFDGNNMSRLVNDRNYQTYANVLAFNFLTSIVGLNISSLTNDANYQTYANVLNFNFLTSIAGLNISTLTNDSNYQTYNNVLNFNYQKRADFNLDINKWTQNQACTGGQVLTGIGLNYGCVTASAGDVNYTPIVFDGNNMSRLVNDRNYQTYANVLGFNFLTSITGLNISTLTNDSNYQNYTNTLNLLNGLVPYTGATTSINLNNKNITNANDVNAGQLHADNNITIGTKGYIKYVGSSLIIGTN